MSAKKILVVDDEAHITQVLSLKLRRSGYEVLTARDGQEGLQMAEDERPDLVITDLQMPYMNGIEMCAKLREQPETSAIPALLLTARGYALAQEDLERTNIRQMLSKPFSPREILRIVDEYVNKTTSDGGRREAA